MLSSTFRISCSNVSKVTWATSQFTYLIVQISVQKGSA
jgi:hypothetical protein